MERWLPFRRSRPDRVLDLVRRVAEARDPGEHGDGVEVVLEAPRTKWWRALFDRDDTLAQARIVVTRAGGEVRYPFDIQLVTAYGAGAAHRLGTRPGWAVSNSAGLAFVIQKGTHRTAFDFEELTMGAIAALAKLRRKPQERGWRVRVDRNVKRQ
ncbi:hypothetical protein [Dactylosporangium matsuzakiense]|uniref:Uncharacterized protein n=1 Tax=Dactylosporangium matsuzakiense TaxID=53360 RepID=A0A9W6NNA4_9ACTN|nr:hypothetical protein [Dactylosporangium matsuzakiense]UWZ43527.1 hypothetical protein Dmats_39735 [Dactylosporangium matsuzakiense]GLL03028.1 hypothetical protein GCM10017581_047700 [Dactylosporangium matsuzakiense]